MNLHGYFGVTMSNCTVDNCAVNQAGRKARIRDEQESREVGDIWGTMAKAGLVGHYNGVPFIVNPMKRIFQTKEGKWVSVESRVWTVAEKKALQEEEAMHKRLPDVYPRPGLYAEKKLKERWFTPMHRVLSDLYMKYQAKRKEVVHDERVIETNEVWSNSITQYDATYWIPLDHYDTEYDHRKSEGIVNVCPCCGSEHIILSKSKDRLIHECAVKRSPWRIGKTDYVSTLDGAHEKSYHIYVEKDTGREFSTYEALSENREWKWFDEQNNEVKGKVDYKKHKQYKRWIMYEPVEDVTEAESQTWVTNFWKMNVFREDEGMICIPIWQMTEKEVVFTLETITEALEYGSAKDRDEYDTYAHALRLRLDELGRKKLREESWEERKYLHKVEEVKIEEYEEVSIEDIDDEALVGKINDIYGIEEDYTVDMLDDEWM